MPRSKPKLPRHRCIARIITSNDEHLRLILVPGSKLIIARTGKAPLIVNMRTGTVTELDPYRTFS